MTGNHDFDFELKKNVHSLFVISKQIELQLLRNETKIEKYAIRFLQFTMFSFWKLQQRSMKKTRMHEEMRVWRFDFFVYIATTMETIYTGIKTRFFSLSLSRSLFFFLSTAVWLYVSPHKIHLAFNFFVCLFSVLFQIALTHNSKLEEKTFVHSDLMYFRGRNFVQKKFFFYGNE